MTYCSRGQVEETSRRPLQVHGRPSEGSGCNACEEIVNTPRQIKRESEIPNSVNPIFDVFLLVARANEVPDDFEVLEFPWFETFGIVKNEAVIVG